MAVKITLDGSVKIVNPASDQFILDELNDQVQGWIEPTKMGPIWVMHAENAKEKKEPLNQIASFFFDAAMYGTVLVVPPQQMPSEWELLEKEDDNWSPDQIDMGFLTALQTTLVIHRMLTDGNNDNKKKTYKEEWAFRPSDKIDESVKDFFKQAYDSIISYKGGKEHVIFEDDSTLVKTESKTDHLKTIDQMIEYFVEEEEYEKCAALQRVKKTVEETS